MCKGTAVQYACDSDGVRKPHVLQVLVVQTGLRVWDGAGCMTRVAAVFSCKVLVDRGGFGCGFGGVGLGCGGIGCSNFESKEWDWGVVVRPAVLQDGCGSVRKSPDLANGPANKAWSLS